MPPYIGSCSQERTLIVLSSDRLFDAIRTRWIPSNYPIPLHGLQAWDETRWIRFSWVSDTLIEMAIWSYIPHLGSWAWLHGTEITHRNLSVCINTHICIYVMMRYGLYRFDRFDPWGATRSARAGQKIMIWNCLIFLYLVEIGVVIDHCKCHVQILVRFRRIPLMVLSVYTFWCDTDTI